MACSTSSVMWSFLTYFFPMRHMTYSTGSVIWRFLTYFLPMRHMTYSTGSVMWRFLTYFFPMRHMTCSTGSVMWSFLINCFRVKLFFANSSGLSLSSNEICCCNSNVFWNINCIFSKNKSLFQVKIPGKLQPYLCSNTIFMIGKTFDC